MQAKFTVVSEKFVGSVQSFLREMGEAEMTVAEFRELHLEKMEEDLAEFRESLEKIFKTGRPRKTKDEKPTDMQDIFQESIEEMNETRELNMMGKEDKFSKVADKKETARLKKEKMAEERAIKAAKKEQEKQERMMKKEQEKQEKAAKRAADMEAKKMAKLAKISENLGKPKRSRAKPKEVEPEPRPELVERDGVTFIVFSDSEYILRDTQCFCGDILVGKWDGESIEMYGSIEMVEMEFNDVVFGEETMTATFSIDKHCNVYDGEIIGVYKPHLHEIIRNKLSKEEMEELFGDLSDLEDELEKKAEKVEKVAEKVVEKVEVADVVEVEEKVEEVAEVVEKVEEVAEVVEKAEEKMEEVAEKVNTKKETKEKKEKKEEKPKKRFTRTGDNVFDSETKLNYILRDKYCFSEENETFRVAGSWGTEIKFIDTNDDEDEVSVVMISLIDVKEKQGKHECTKTAEYMMDFNCNIFDDEGDKIGCYNPMEHVIYMAKEDEEESEEEYD